MHKTWIKFLAVFLCGLSLLTVGLSLWGLMSFTEMGLYSGTLEKVQDKQMAEDMKVLSERIASRYAASQLTEPTDAFLESFYQEYDRENQVREPEAGKWYYEIYNYDTGSMEQIGPGSPDITDAVLYKEYLVVSKYPRVLPIGEDEFLLPDEEPLLPGIGQEERPGELPADAKEHELIDPDTGLSETYYYTTETGPVYKVRIKLLPGAYEQQVAYLWKLLETAYEHKYLPLVTLPIGLLLLAVAITWLAVTAGKKQGREGLEPGGLNRAPLDLYLILTAGGVVGTLLAVGELLRSYFARETAPVIIGGGVLLCLCCCLLVTGFLYAAIAQMRVKGFVWKHSGLRAFGMLLRVTGHKLGQLSRLVLAVLPMSLQWVLWVVVLCGAVALAALVRELWLILVVALFVLVSLFYVLHSFKTLFDGAKRMSKGDLQTPVDTQYLMGSFGDFAIHLNALADVATVAAQKQMRSERMRAELITNVSHDIKTPLTSIINYVDLLQNDPDPQAAAQYLEVLSRQSARMKKLIDDLIELSKASTGNMPVELSALDAGEYLMQAVGEFSDKLEKAGLEPVLQLPEEQVLIRCDSRLTWRVLSNLMSNAVKYALPGTRLYIDLEQRDGKVLLSLKNISRNPLNISPEELMERFVRGDTARNTEGSGLGLNIAKSLMELQKGQLLLTVDGDLFKATLSFDALP